MNKDTNYYKSDYRKKWKGWLELPAWKEGNSGNSIDYQSFMFDFIKDNKPKNILEIGFNAGHSACCFLNASPNSKLIAFDICRWKTEEPACSILKKYFDIQLIKGDSTQTVPEYMKQNSEYFDFVFIDGGHIKDIPYLDMINTKDRVSTGGHMLIDDLEHQNIHNCFERIDWSDYKEIYSGKHQPNNPRAPLFGRNVYKKYKLMLKL